MTASRMRPRATLAMPIPMPKQLARRITWRVSTKCAPLRSRAVSRRVRQTMATPLLGSLSAAQMQPLAPELCRERHSPKACPSYLPKTQQRGLSSKTMLRTGQIQPPSRARSHRRARVRTLGDWGHPTAIVRVRTVEMIGPVAMKGVEL